MPLFTRQFALVALISIRIGRLKKWRQSLRDATDLPHGRGWAPKMEQRFLDIVSESETAVAAVGTDGEDDEHLHFLALALSGSAVRDSPGVPWL
jgi:hypothetical protein